MNEAAANFAAEEFLRGSFQALEGALEATTTHEVSELGDLTAEDLETILSTQPAALRARVEGGGAVALLLRAQDSAAIADLQAGSPVSGAGEVKEKPELTGTQVAALKTLAAGLFDAASSHLTSLIGDELNFEQAEAVDLAGTSAGELREYIGGSATMARFSYTVEGHIDGSGVLLFSRSMEGRIPESVLASASAPGTAGEALVSDEEMKDILSGFSAASEGGGRAKGGKRPESANLDVILDIELTAVARLGSVEMPISDILSLGPGSIIDVGQLVDEPIELLVNNKLVARGDVVVVEEKFGLRITEIVSQRERLESIRE